MNRQTKIERLAQMFSAAGMTGPLARASAEEILNELFPPLEPIVYDPEFNRAYIPMIGESEIQTKGKGSSFRVYFDGDRINITGGSYEEDFLTGLARYIREQYGE